MFLLVSMSGCLVEAPIFYINNTGNVSTFWFFNETNGSLQYKANNVWIQKDLFVNQLIVRNTTSIFIGGRNFSTISATEVFLPIVNRSRITVVISQNFFTDDDFNGTKFMSNINRNFDPLSSAFVGASDPLGNGMTLVKWNENHESPFLGQLAALFGDMEILTTDSNDFGPGGDNQIRIGFYQNLTVTNVSFSVTAFNKRNWIMIMNTTRLDFLKPALANITVGYRNLDALEIPDEIINYTLMYCKDNDRCYIKRPDGVERRLVDSGAGSIHFDEEIEFHNTSVFHNATSFSYLTGDGSAFACLNFNGEIYRSLTSCN